MAKNGKWLNSVVPLAFVCSGLVILATILVELNHSYVNRVMLQPPSRTLLETIQDSMMHKDLFPLDHYDIIGTILVGVGLMIAASGGVGGGGILVPLLIIVFGFHPKKAIPLSNFTILGSSITNMILNLPKRHPDAERPLVDWDLILVMEPVTMAGAVGYWHDLLLLCLLFACLFVATLPFTSIYTQKLNFY